MSDYCPTVPEIASFPTSTRTTPPSSLEGLSAEILNNVFGYLDYSDRSAASDVCAFWERLIVSDQEMRWRTVKFTLRSFIDEVANLAGVDLSGAPKQLHTRPRPTRVIPRLVKSFTHVAYHVQYLSGTMEECKDPSIIAFFADLVAAIGPSMPLFPRLHTLNMALPIPTILNSLESPSLSHACLGPLDSYTHPGAHTDYSGFISGLSLNSSNLWSLRVNQEFLFHFHHFNLFQNLSKIALHIRTSHTTAQSVSQLKNLKELEIFRLAVEGPTAQPSASKEERNGKADCAANRKGSGGSGGDKMGNVKAGGCEQGVGLGGRSGAKNKGKGKDRDRTKNARNITKSAPIYCFTSVEKLTFAIPKREPWKSQALNQFAFPVLREFHVLARSFYHITPFLLQYTSASDNLRSVFLHCPECITKFSILDTLSTIPQLETVVFVAKGHSGWKGPKAARAFLPKLPHLRRFEITSSEPHSATTTRNVLNAEVLNDFLTCSPSLEVLSLPVDAADIESFIERFTEQGKFEGNQRGQITDIRLTLFNFPNDAIITKVAWWFAKVAPNIEVWSLEFHGHPVGESNDWSRLLVDRYRMYVGGTGAEVFGF